MCGSEQPDYPCGWEGSGQLSRTHGWEGRRELGCMAMRGVGSWPSCVGGWRPGRHARLPA